MKKLIILLGFMGVGFGFFSTFAEVKNAEVVFKKWFEWQHLYSASKSFQDMGNNADGLFVKNFKQKYESNLLLLRKALPFLSILTDGQINNYGHEIKATISPTFAQNLSTCYSLLEADMPGFIRFLEKASFTTPSIARDEAVGISHDVIEKDNAIMELLFPLADSEQKEELLFGVANRFFEYCFSEKTFPEFQQLLLKKEMYPIARLLYAVTWFRLAGNGWKNWCTESLKTLKESADKGNQIVYIAGGSDIYQLIKAGIYNIKNIDPQLPSQPKYYADGWTWILCGDGSNSGIGDKMIFNSVGKRISMERVGFTVDGTTFKARLANGQIFEIPRSTTTWNILDEDGKQLGSYVLERRFVEQRDFDVTENQTLLMSFNELFYVSLPDFMDGWGIEPAKFPEKLNVVIKQLRYPVSKRMICNIRIADLLNTSDFKFISLGTCIN